MSDPLAERLRTLREAGVVVARFDGAGALTFVRFGVVDGGMVEPTEDDKKPNPVREAALRLARQVPAAAES